MIMRKFSIITLTAIFVSLILTSFSTAQDSLLISYQGRLTDDGGNPINGSQAMIFTIYDGIGVSKWAESHPAVLVSEGLFNVILGSQSALPDSVFNGDDRFLGITIGADPEITPQTLLTASPSSAVSRRVVGDIVTAPGVLHIMPPSDDGQPPPDDNIPAIELSATDVSNAITINKPPPDDNKPGVTMESSSNLNSFKIDWGVPPDDSKPAFKVESDELSETISMFLGVPPDDGKPPFEVVSDGLSESISMFLGVPPDDNLPVFELVGDAAGQSVSMKLSPPPDDSKPALEVTVDIANKTSSLNLQPPPDDSKPSIGMSVDAVNNEGWLSLTNYDALGSAPGMAMNTGADISKMTVGWFIPPPDDNMPPPDDSKPMAQISNSATTSSIVVAGPSGTDYNPSQVVIETNSSQAQIMLSSETTVGELVPLVMTTNQTSASIGIGTESPSDELYVVGDITATGAITELSSLKYKTNVSQMSDALEKVRNLRGVNYTWRTDEYPEMKFSEDQQVGLIAEEVQKVIPQLVHSDNNGEMSVDYSKLTAVLIEAFKEQQKLIEELSNRLEELEGKKISER